MTVELGMWLSGLIVLAACIIVVVIPPSLDPAIRLMEWLEDRRNGR
jgi:hypothetical protein